MPRHRQRSRRARSLDELIDMFPFLSMMLCIVGVLAFILVMLVITKSRVRVQLAGDVVEAYKVGYQIVCFGQGSMLIPPGPDPRLAQLAEKAKPSERLRIDAIRSARCARLRSLAGSGKFGRDQAEATTAELTAAQVEEVRFLNRMARQYDVLYEEFLLFGIYPGGGPTYHAWRAELINPQNQNLQTGLNPLSPTWVFAAPSARGCP